MSDYQTALDAMSTSIVVLDQDLVVQYINQATEELIQVSANRAINTSLGQVVPDNNELQGACKKSLAQSVSVTLRDQELRLPTVMSSRRVDCVINPLQINPLRSGSVQFVPSFGLVLELKQIEMPHYLAADNSLSDRQQSNIAVIKGLAHEIRNPLGGVRGAAQLLAAELADSSLIEYTGIIIREADRLTNLVNRMQATGTPSLNTPVNIHSVLEQVRQLLLAESHHSVQVLQDYDPSLPPVSGDHEQLVQAVINIARNAVEATGSNGVIRFCTRIDHQFMLSSQASQQVVRVNIIDNGPGINPEFAGQIFDPMVTGRRNGTGLGLAITSEIIHAHDGLIDATSEPGETTFSLYLPIHDESAGSDGRYGEEIVDGDRDD